MEHVHYNYLPNQGFSNCLICYNNSYGYPFCSTCMYLYNNDELLRLLNNEITYQDIYRSDKSIYFKIINYAETIECQKCHNDNYCIYASNMVLCPSCGKNFFEIPLLDFIHLITNKKLKKAVLQTLNNIIYDTSIYEEIIKEHLEKLNPEQKNKVIEYLNNLEITKYHHYKLKSVNEYIFFLKKPKEFIDFIDFIKKL